MVVKMTDLLAKRESANSKRAPLVETLKTLAALETLTPEQVKEFEDAEKSIAGIDAELKDIGDHISRVKAAEAAAASQAQPVEGQHAKAEPTVKTEIHPVGGLVKALYNAQGNYILAGQWAEKNYGENHPVTKALNTSTAATGGATVPEDFANQLIELLRPATVVRSSGPNVIPMPRGTMRMAKQNGTVTGAYGSEGSRIKAEQPSVGNIVATFKKLTVLVPISNDWLRYSSPATDGLVQNDIVLGLARTEDLAFIRGDGTADWPLGLRNIALSGNLIASDSSPTLTTVDSELSKAILALEAANVPMIRPVWLFHPRVKQFLLTLKNSNGFYVYRDEMVNNGTLRGYPFKTTTQIPVTLGAGTATEVYLCDMSQALIFDALALSVAMSVEASYTDSAGNARSSFDRDETIIRAIAEHDFHMRHDEAVAVITGVVWA